MKFVILYTINNDELVVKADVSDGRRFYHGDYNHRWIDKHAKLGDKCLQGDLSEEAFEKSLAKLLASCGLIELNPNLN